MTGSKEDVETVRAVLSGSTRQTARRPAARGERRAPGIIRAIEECFPRSARQRCLARRMRNLGKGLCGSVAGIQDASHCLSSSGARESRYGCRPASALDCANVRPSTLAVSKTISRAASPPCGCPSRTAVSFRAVKISLSGCELSCCRIVTRFLKFIFYTNCRSMGSLVRLRLRLGCGNILAIRGQGGAVSRHAASLVETRVGRLTKFGAGWPIYRLRPEC